MKLETGRVERGRRGPDKKEGGRDGRRNQGTELRESKMKEIANGDTQEGKVISKEESKA